MNNNIEKAFWRGFEKAANDMPDASSGIMDKIKNFLGNIDPQQTSKAIPESQLYSSLLSGAGEGSIPAMWAGGIAGGGLGSLVGSKENARRNALIGALLGSSIGGIGGGGIGIIHTLKELQEKFPNGIKTTDKILPWH